MIVIVMEKKKTNMIWQHPNLIANYMHSLLLNDALHNDNYTAAAVTRDMPQSPAICISTCLLQYK